MRITAFTSNPYWEDYYIKNDTGTATYLVTVDVKEQTVYCTCPNFKYRCNTVVNRCKFGGLELKDTAHHCKHIRYALSIREVLKDG